MLCEAQLFVKLKDRSKGDDNTKQEKQKGCHDPCDPLQQQQMSISFHEISLKAWYNFQSTSESSLEQVETLHIDAIIYIYI